jgi:putative hemolysin
MNSVWMPIIVIAILILVGGCFVAAELALVSMRDSQVARVGQDSGRRGRRLIALTSNPNRFLAAAQIAVTLAGFLSAAFGESKISPFVVPIVVGWGISESAAEIIVLLVITSIIAYFSLVIGELVPKRIALQKTEEIALIAATPIDIIATILRPVIALLSVSTDFVVRLMGLDPKAGRDAISGEELRDLVAAHEELTVEERELITDVFDAGDRELREVMVPRTEVDFLDASMPVRKAAQLVADQPHSRYPVIRDSADDVIGFVHVRDILNPELLNRSIRVGDLAREVTSFPGSKEVLRTLTEMRRLRQHLSIVQDEYGGTAGIVTMEDLVEELIGDIRDEYDVEDAPARAQQFGVFVVDGLLNLEDFEDDTGVTLPEGPYETVAGFVMSRLGRVPLLGDVVVDGHHEFEVMELDGRRVSRVRVTHVAPVSIGGLPIDGLPVHGLPGQPRIGDEGSSGAKGHATE